MTENSKIEWTDHTFNPWRGCTKVGPGCDNCYAAAMNDRWRWGVWGPGNRPKRTKTWGGPRKWQRQAAAFYAEHGRRQRVFCASLADVFDNNVPPEWRADLWELVGECPDLDWIIVTKRIGNAEKMLPEGGPHPNIWLIATIVNQEEAERDIDKLAATTAMIRGLSMEPLLGPVNLLDWLGPWGPPGSLQSPPMVDWIIVGGESGPGARDMDPDWARSIRDQCRNAGVAFFMKQMTKKAPIPEDLMVRNYPHE